MATDKDDGKKEYPKAIYDKDKHEGGKLIAIVNSKEEEDALKGKKGWGGKPQS
jgi:hypothetical protein